jgi:uncharacterized membrane protein HdeD (DUF308 family)
MAATGPMRALTPVVAQDQPMTATDAFWTNVGTALAVTGTAVGAYHGYKRNDSVGWAIVWGLLGGLAPIIVIPVAFAQGITRHR